MLNKLLDDLRFPIGLLFIIFGLILTVMGLANPVKMDCDLNLNLLSGIIMDVFALFMLGTAILAVKNSQDVPTR
jgi:hypothetical protein